jgi:hypothetical protein
MILQKMIKREIIVGFSIFVKRRFLCFEDSHTTVEGGEKWHQALD